MEPILSASQCPVNHKPPCFGRPRGHYFVHDTRFPRLLQNAYARPEQCLGCQFRQPCFSYRHLRAREQR
jgi:hypothetical protein